MASTAVAMVRESCSGLTGQLRWFSSAAALVDREDRTEALLDRYEKSPARLQQVETLYQRFLLHQDDVPMELFPKERREQAHADYTQILDLADAIAQRAREVSASRAGAPPDRPTMKTPVGLLTRLPNLDLPRFDGRFDAWMGFIGLFESLVDSREDLSPSQKLAYLLSVLDGEARGLVQHLPIGDGSYQVARSLLAKRYQNQRCLADAHIDQIMDIPAVSNTAQLRTKLLNPLVVATNALSRLGLPVDQWSYLLVRIVLKRLPVSLRARFEQGHARDEAPLPTFEQLLTFLEDECRVGDVMVADTPVASTSSRSSNQRRTTQTAPAGRAPPRFAVAQVPRPDCRYCGSQGHRTAQCPEFAALHVAARRRIAKARRWCFSCLGNHLNRDCPDTHSCPICGGQHLRVLCANANARRDHPGSPSGGYVSGRREQLRTSESGSPPPRRAECAATEHRQRSMRSPTGGYDNGPRVQSRTSVCGSPPLRSRGQSRSPPVVYHDYRDARPARLPSPPLAERPRLQPRNPPYGRSRRYEPPAMARGSRHREEVEFRPLPHFDAPTGEGGVRSPPRQR